MMALVKFSGLQNKRQRREHGKGESGEEAPEVEEVIKGGEGVISTLNVCVGLSSIENLLIYASEDCCAGS